MSKSRILLIEDDLLLNQMFSEILETELDVEVEGILDGQQALDRLSGPVADIVLLDLHLPKVSGLYILNQLRADARWQKASVIVLSADVLRLEAASERADLTLAKPVSFEDLVGFVGRFISCSN